MAYYWFAKNIPELQEVEPANRRGWLDVAVDRSESSRARTLFLAARAAAVAALIQIDKWPVAALILLLGYVAVVWFLRIRRQQHARAWLCEHLHEFRADEPATRASQS